MRVFAEKFDKTTVSAGKQWFPAMHHIVIVCNKVLVLAFFRNIVLAGFLWIYL